MKLTFIPLIKLNSFKNANSNSNSNLILEMSLKRELGLFKSRFYFKEVSYEKRSICMINNFADMLNSSLAPEA